MQVAANVKNKRILITGGASGIGAASAKLLASRGAKAGLRFNAVCPSFIDTPMVQNTLAKLDERSQTAIIKASPLKRLGKVEEIANAIAWLSSDESTFMNGHAFTLDGGMLA